MDTCFVIQPFDNGNFDKRFTDIFEPAIKKAGLSPYRIDKDLSVRIPIDDIEKGITESYMCFAEITTDNPNVWYELGYAFARNKDVVMVCSEERGGNKFPFDIQHRQIIQYKTGSKSDFETLEDTIIKKIQALQQKTKTVETLNTTPVVDTEGLKGHQIALLILMMENQLSSSEGMTAYSLQTEMSKAGYTVIATSVGIKTLVNSGMVENFMAIDYQDGEPYPAFRLTEAGEAWILNNQDQLVYRRDTSGDHMGDGLPF